VTPRVPRVGIVGFGTIGQGLYTALQDRSHGIAVAFVHARDPTRLAGVPQHLVAHDLAAMRAARPDLVIEAAHPNVTRASGAAILEFADYLPVSVSGLADASLLTSLLAQARNHGTHLLIPHGAIVGADSLFEWRHSWDSVSITFCKHPRNIDWSQSPWRDREITSKTMVFDGTVRDIAAQFPRNVNAMVACALMTIGVDACRARLIADPEVKYAELHIVACGRDGALLDIRRKQPATGVSGTEMAHSVLRSVLRATHQMQTLEFI
jgi:aspartate dehydrogenase